MNTLNILVGVISDFEAWVMPRRFVDRLRAEFPGHQFLEAWDKETVRRLLPESDVAFTPCIDEDVFASARRLRWVQSPAVGVGSLLFPSLVASDVVLTTARGIRARAIAEHVLGVSIALARQLHVAIRHQALHEWAQDLIEGPDRCTVRTLLGARLGIVGLGSIGLEVARIAAPFGLRVSGIRRRADRPLPDGVDEVLPPERLHDLLQQSDIVLLSAPTTASTRHLIGKAELDVVKRGAFLVNIGRGRLIDDEAVIAALRDGRLGGAALDVFVHEPLDPASPYWDLPNVIITPHTSGAMADYWTPLVDLFCDNLRRFEAGRPLRNVADKRAGY